MLGRCASAARRLLRRRGRSEVQTRNSIVSAAAVLAIVGVLVTLEPSQAFITIHRDDPLPTSAATRYARLVDRATDLADGDPTIGILDFRQRDLLRAMVDSERQPVIEGIAPASFRDTEPIAATKPKPAPKPSPKPAPKPRVVIAPPEPRFLGVSPWHVAGSTSWYGPGLYGNTTACGQRYTKHIVGVAHRTLPCGTLVQLSWHGMTVVAPVIDRGPYGQASNVFDLSRALACEKLRLQGETNGCFTRFHVRWRIVERNR